MSRFSPENLTSGISDLGSKVTERIRGLGAGNTLRPVGVQITPEERAQETADFLKRVPEMNALVEYHNQIVSGIWRTLCSKGLKPVEEISSDNYRMDAANSTMTYTIGVTSEKVASRVVNIMKKSYPNTSTEVGKNTVVITIPNCGQIPKLDSVQ